MRRVTVAGRGRRWAVLAVLAVALALAAGCGAASNLHTGPDGGLVTVAHPEIGFRDARRLDEHYRKHGPEFGGIGRDEYLRRAQSLRDRPIGGAVLQAVRDDGVATRFDRATGDFIAFDHDLVIRTFFRPNDGEAYFMRQARR